MRSEERLAHGVEQPDHELEAMLLLVELEQMLLGVRWQLHLRGEIERELRRRLVDLVQLGAGDRRERTERLRGTRRHVGIDALEAVGHWSDDRREKRAAAREALH